MERLSSSQRKKYLSMESSVDELGKLKYSLSLDISLKEIKPTYDDIYRQLKNTRLNGFRPGKHPKGWLEKRFLSAMHQEAVDRVSSRLHGKRTKGALPASDYNACNSENRF